MGRPVVVDRDSVIARTRGLGSCHLHGAGPVSSVAVATGRTATSCIGSCLGATWLLAFVFKGPLELGCVHQILGTRGRQLGGEEIVQAEEIRFRTANIQCSSVPPASPEADAGDALQDIDPIGYDSDDQEVLLVGQRLLGGAKQWCAELPQSGVNSLRVLLRWVDPDVEILRAPRFGVDPDGMGPDDEVLGLRSVQSLEQFLHVIAEWLRHERYLPRR